jgi:hypothetical protein
MNMLDTIHSLPGNSTEYHTGISPATYILSAEQRKTLLDGLSSLNESTRSPMFHTNVLAPRVPHTNLLGRCCAYPSDIDIFKGEYVENRSIDIAHGSFIIFEAISGHATPDSRAKL